MRIEVPPPSAYFWSWSIDDLHALYEYRAVMERQVERILAEREAERELYLSGDLHAALRQEHSDSRFPEIFRGSFCVAAWSLFEYTVREIGRTLAARGRDALSERGGFPDLAARYFDQQLSRNVYRTDEIREAIALLYAVRNVIAHGNAVHSLVREDHGERVVRAAKDPRSGLNTDAGYLRISEVYTAAALEAVTQATVEAVGAGRTYLDTLPREVVLHGSD